MSESNFSLALALLKNHPKVAAGIFEQTRVEEAANFLKELNDNEASNAFVYVMPSYTARLCKALPNNMAIKLLSPLEESQVAIIMRYMDKRYRDLILSELPKKRAATIKLLLKFSQNTIGAWITPKIAITTIESTLAETLNHLADNDDFASSSCVFVVNRDYQYQGRLYYLDIVKNKPTDLVIQHTKFEQTALAANMSINIAYENESWYQYEAIPVLDQRKKFIGVLEHRNLRNAMAHIKNQPSKDKRNNELTSVGEIYGNTLISVFQSMSKVMQSDLRQ